MSTEALPTSAFFDIVVHGPVIEIAMNRPEKANGMNAAFWDDLPGIVQTLDARPEIRALVLTGRGKHFTSGMDLSSFQDIMGLMQREPGRGAYALRKLILRLQDSFTALERTRLPVIAAIHGACIGGGIDLITACDIRLASRDARFSIEEINIGMTADVGTLQRLPKLIAPGIAAELALTGRRFDADEAQGWGLINSVHDDAEAVRIAALEAATTIAAKSPLAIAGIKQALTYARDHSVADGLDQIATWNGGMLRPEDLMGAIQAKAAKVEAVFKDIA